ncbi:hypothetical protein [uncultured Maricaulis sp.]|jgi:hypothetical protein|uniref:hypothetical protein n=1 Tax=uncultured Maricaulis sp. TaxID=174710 RepID=UPI0030DD7993|tara:strand:- start:579 stop:1019 length:441 start_codon:yes stop_codon:yes gene_type:complete
MSRRGTRPLTRFGLSLPFVLAVMAMAFGAGTYLGGHFLVPPGQGLAAPAEAMGYGLLAALIALVIAIFAAVKMPLKTLGLLAIAGLIVCLALATSLTLAMRRAEAEREAAIRDLQTPRASTQAMEPACASPGSDTPDNESPPCPDD